MQSMTAVLATIEPTQARAGDTWRWQIALPDYPAPTWSLLYTLFSAAGVVSFTSTAAGTEHLIHLLPAVTAEYPPGRYDWVSHVSDGTDRYPIGANALQILPDLATATSYDGRSHARKVLDAIDALIENRATSGDVDLVSAASGDSQMARSLPDLLRLRDRYAAMVAQEEQAAARARGETIGCFGGQMVQVRFRP
jgi:hypothetical protein